ncbi:MAG: hypothetical protein WBM32_05205 [Crocosphaera sp.]|jgi:hypothetical protein
MSKNLDQMTNQELKAYIKANRDNDQACHEAIKLLMSRQSKNTPQYPHDLPLEEMEAIFKAKLQSLDMS